MLNVKPGAVTPFGLLNDTEKKINFYLDLKLDRFNNFNFHPLVNTATINIKRGEFYKLLKINNIIVNLFNFETYASYDIKQP